MRTATPLAALAVAAGCAQAGSPSVVTRDSAGIRVVDNRAPATPGAILVDSVPAVDIGGERAGPNYEFSFQIGSAFRLGDGRIVGSGWAKPEFRIYDSAGKWLQTVGRQGSGPGEFEALGWVYRGPADTLVTFEPGRLQWFDPAGRFVRFQTPTEPGWIRGIFDDGTLVAVRSRPAEDHGTTETIRRWRTLLRYHPAGQAADSLAGLLGGPEIRTPDGQNSVGRVPFAPVPSWSAGGRLVVALGDAGEFTLRDRSGAVTHLVRFPVTPTPVTDSDLTAELARAERFDPKLRAWLEDRIRRLATARVRPPVTEAFAARDGKFWLGLSRPAGRPGMAVFDSSGRWLAEVDVPREITVYDIGRDYLLGVRTDADGFLHILVFRVRKR